jgi:hypothetical protein
MQTEYTFSKRQIEYLSGEVRGSNVPGIPSTCAAHIRKHIIERRARTLGIKPEEKTFSPQVEAWIAEIADEKAETMAEKKAAAAAPAFTGRFLRPSF